MALSVAQIKAIAAKKAAEAAGKSPALKAFEKRPPASTPTSAVPAPASIESMAKEIASIQRSEITDLKNGEPEAIAKQAVRAAEKIITEDAKALNEGRPRPSATTIDTAVNILMAADKILNPNPPPIAGVRAGTTPSATGLGNVLRQSLDVDSVVDQVIKSTNGNVVQKVTTTEFNRYAQNYAAMSPNVLFITEYIIDGKNLGVLIVFEKYSDSSHYEVFKKNVFSDNIYQRILFLDEQNLSKETKHYVKYLTDVLEIDLPNDSYYIIFDPLIKDDRIYEYKIRAAKLPASANEVDYDAILGSKDLLNKVILRTLKPGTIFDFSSETLGSVDLAWTVALLNEGVDFFGLNAKTVPISTVPTISRPLATSLLTAKDINNINALMIESISLFGAQKTLEHLINNLGGLSDDFRNAFLASIDVEKIRFSYDSFISLTRNISPVFNLVLSIAESGDKGAELRLSKVGIQIPQEKGSVALNSIQSLSEIFRFVNLVYLTVIYGKENIELIKKVVRPVLYWAPETGSAYTDVNGDLWTKPIPPEAIILFYGYTYDPVTNNVYDANGALVGNGDDRKFHPV